MNALSNRTINFSSENFSGIHPAIMNALIAANLDTVPSYGEDMYTRETVDIFKQHFGENIEVFFTFNGTGANNFGLGCVVERHQAIFCSEQAHLYVNESTAPEAFIGGRIYPVNSSNGKICIEDLENKIKSVNGIHFPQPKVISITQPTECGTVYTKEELSAIRKICSENKVLLHVDGARFFNAAASLNLSLRELSRDIGVDILTLGGTKNGLMFGEAVIFFNLPGTIPFKYNLKRSMQLASKNRFVAVQFLTLLKNELWKDIAMHTNSLARVFASMLTESSVIKIIYPVESNAVFVELPPDLQTSLKEKAGFYLWDERKNICRFMFSFDNTMDEIEFFIREAKMIGNKILNHIGT
jgi:threonine aldolase